MALTETGVSIAVLAIVLILGLKILKHVIYAVILIVILAGILWFFGYLDPSSLGTLLNATK